MECLSILPVSIFCQNEIIYLYKEVCELYKLIKNADLLLNNAFTQISMDIINAIKMQLFG